jgi:hypothetical protein
MSKTKLALQKSQKKLKQTTQQYTHQMSTLPVEIQTLKKEGSGKEIQF